MKKHYLPATTGHMFTRRELLLLGIGASLLPSDLAAADTRQGLMQATPRQTAGPFYPNWSQADRDADLTRVAGRSESASGELIQVSGRVLTPDNKPIEGVLIEIWQANAQGRYAHEADSNPAPIDQNFQGWGQMATDANGAYQFTTIMPGPYPVSRSWSRPPHIHFKLQKPGFSTLTTQMYFAGHPLNDLDALLLQHGAEERNQLIVAFDDRGVSNGSRPVRSGVFNIVLEA